MKKFEKNDFYNYTLPVYPGQSNPPISSQGDSMKKTVLTHGLLSSVSHVLRVSQAIGITPISVNSGPRGKSKTKSQVSSASAPWMSLPSMLNCLCIIHLAWITVWVFLNIKSILGIMFSGTDLYTFAVQILLSFILSMLILIHSFLRRNSLAKLWNVLNRISIDITRSDTSKENYLYFYALRCPSLLERRLKRLKRINVGITFCILALEILYSAYFLYFAFRKCSLGNDEIEVLDSKARVFVCPLADWVLFVEKITYIFMEMYQQVFSALFCVLCLFIRVMYIEVGDQLKLLLTKKGHEEDSNWSGITLEKLRIVHGQLSDCCRLMGSYFGLPILGACIASVVSITASIYMALVGYTDITSNFKLPEEEEVSKYSMLWGYHGISGLLTLCFNLGAGQMVQNAVELPVRILGSESHKNLNTEEKYEVSLFLQKSHSLHSSGISAYNITTIGLSFIAAAVTNVTTYILVLLQFRLGVDKATSAPN